jgi:hypothetical protein
VLSDPLERGGPACISAYLFLADPYTTIDMASVFSVHAYRSATLSANKRYYVIVVILLIASVADLQ